MAVVLLLVLHRVHGLIKLASDAVSGGGEPDAYSRLVRREFGPRRARRQEEFAAPTQPTRPARVEWGKNEFEAVVAGE